MEYTCHSEFHKLESVFIKTVDQAFVNETRLKEEWAALNYLSQPNFNKAREEYKVFESLLAKTVPNICYMPEVANVTMDSIYCRDASIATNYGVILCNMGKSLRMPEPNAQRTVYEANSIKILGAIKPPGTLEGGDVAWLDENTLAVGHTYRTNMEGIEQLKNLLSPFNIQIMVVDLPHYKGQSDVFHLMSIFSPVDKDLAVVYSPLMPIRFRKELIGRGFQLVEVPDQEFDSMGCNVLAVAPRKWIMVHGNPITVSALKNAGCEVFIYKGEEISVKGGGGPTCLTRPIKRRL